MDKITLDKMVFNKMLCKICWETLYFIVEPLKKTGAFGVPD